MMFGMVVIDYLLSGVSNLLKLRKDFGGFEPKRDSRVNCGDKRLVDADVLGEELEGVSDGVAHSCLDESASPAKG
jgi:hypothetical protein